MARAPSPERLAKAAIRDQMRAFRKKFGRDPGPDDSVFFDPDAPGDQPVQISEEALRDGTLAAMKQAGTPPEIVYVYRKTGLLLIGGNDVTYPPDRVAERQAAIDEYYRLEGEGRGGQ